MTRTKKYLDTREAAAVLGLQPATLENWRCNNRHRIPYTKVGFLVRYEEADLIAFLESRKVGGDAEGGAR
jgi:hypothetical protein